MRCLAAKVLTYVFCAQKNRLVMFWLRNNKMSFYLITFIYGLDKVNHDTFVSIYLHITYVPSNFTMDLSRFNASSQKEDSISTYTCTELT